MHHFTYASLFCDYFQLLPCPRTFLTLIRHGYEDTCKDETGPCVLQLLSSGAFL